jgi:CO/xanthine dehydrogenase Mo-binding subunit
MADLAGINGERNDFRVVGKPNLPGRLSYAIATGVAKYGADYTAPDMLHAKFLRSPYANAKIKAIKTESAMKIPGVVDIITWQDEDIRALSAGRGFMGPGQPLLSDYADQEGGIIGAIVVAEDEDICEKALRQLKKDAEWEVLPHVVNILEGRKPDAMVIRPPAPAGQGGGFGGFSMGGGNNPPKKGNVSYSNVAAGDIEAGFKEADHIIEYDINLPAFAGHMPDPIGTVAWWFNDPYHGEGKSLRIEAMPGARSGGRHV